ncbi:Quinone oxidoreductase-like protein [Ilyonectria robusta]
MATQIAVAMGCRVLGTAGAAEKCAYAESLGASKCINYTQGHWWERILEETDGRGVDVVFDPVGLVDRSLKCLAHRGRVLVTGFVGLDGQMEKIAMNRVLLKQATLIGYVSLVQTKLRCWKSSNHGLDSDTESLFVETQTNGGSCGKNFNLSWRAARSGQRYSFLPPRGYHPRRSHCLNRTGDSGLELSVTSEAIVSNIIACRPKHAVHCHHIPQFYPVPWLQYDLTTRPPKTPGFAQCLYQTQPARFYMIQSGQSRNTRPIAVC